MPAAAKATKCSPALPCPGLPSTKHSPGTRNIRAPPPTGYETTANSLAYAAYAIAADPEVERKVLAEVDAFGRDRAPTFKDLEASHYRKKNIKKLD